MKRFCIFLSVLLCTVPVLAQTLRQDVSLRVNSETGIYAKGDTVRVWADVKAVPDFDVTFKVMRWCDWGSSGDSPITLHQGENLIFESVFDEAVQYVFELTDGKNIGDFKAGGVNNVFAGIVVAPEEFEVGFDEPKDLRRFWKKEIRGMRKLKMAAEITNDRTKKGYRTYHVDVNCVGPHPVRAYVSHPQNAKPGSLPIIINLHAAGSPGSPSKASVALKYAKCVDGGALAMDLNAHGMLDDQPDEYYDELNNGELKGYSKREPYNRHTYYFTYMMLRAQRAIDYLTKDPLWDGKHIILTGSSQGGYQSAMLAGMDKRVTSIILTVPAGVDQGASVKGRPNSWPKTMERYPEATMDNSPYLDGAILLRHAKADIWCEIGLYDFTCPAANLFAALNPLKVEKTIVTFQRPHSLYPGQTQPEVDEMRWDYFRKAAVK